MKKAFMIVLLIAFCIEVSARGEAEKKTTWYVKVGGTLCTLTDFENDEDLGLSTSSKMGYLVGIAFDKSIGKKGWFWSAGLQLRSKGGKKESYWYENIYDNGASWTDNEHDDYTYNINALEVPLSVGYKLSITNDWAIDLRIGGFINYDLWGNVKEESYGWYDGKQYDNGEEEYDLDDMEGYESLGYGALAGIGVWYKNFNINFTYELGFAETFETGGKERNCLLTIGYAF